MPVLRHHLCTGLQRSLIILVGLAITFYNKKIVFLQLHEWFDAQACTKNLEWYQTNSQLPAGLLDSTEIAITLWMITDVTRLPCKLAKEEKQLYMSVHCTYYIVHQTTVHQAG